MFVLMLWIDVTLMIQMSSSVHAVFFPSGLHREQEKQGSLDVIK